MTEYLVLDDGSVVVHKDVFDGHSRNFCEQDSAKSVCDRRVYTNEREDGVELIIFVEFDLESLRRKSESNSRRHFVSLQVPL